MPNTDMLPSDIRRSTHNHILKSLPDEDLVRMIPHLERVELASGSVIIAPGEPIEYVYFPDQSMISVVAYTISGQCAEAGVIGWEGLAGLDVMMESISTPHEHIVQLPDGAHRVRSPIIRNEFERGGLFQKIALSFMRMMLVQVSQTALCNRLHSVEERLARWLLMCHDRAGSDVLLLTQEFLGIMLGANRTSVTQAAIALQDRGFIEYRRGRITIVDRKGLEHFGCECYRIVSNELATYLK